MLRAARRQASPRSRTIVGLECLEAREMLTLAPTHAAFRVVYMAPHHLTPEIKTAAAVSRVEASVANAATINLRHVRAAAAHDLARVAREAKAAHPRLPVLRPSLEPSMILYAGNPEADATAAPPASAYIPSQIRRAFGFDLLAGQGEGMTVAIVDAYDNPTISSDLATFSTYYGLPQMDGVGGNPTFTKVTPPGQAAPVPNVGWAQEIALDVEWVHAAAPRANIVLVETTDNAYTNLITNANSGVNYAKALPGVVVVSNSYGSNEFSGETTFESSFTQVAGHAPVAFTFSTGDDGAPGSYPAYSPSVIAVGGTSLTTSSARGNYGREKGWAGSGGGTSQFITKPSYQNAPFFAGLTKRSIPDISMVADPNTGVAVYSSYGFGGWSQIGGTSLSAPLFSAVVALVDQARATNGFAPLDSATILSRLYADYNSANYSTDFHDVTTGTNGGFNAVAGYDRVTGIGSPKVDKIVPLLAATA